MENTDNDAFADAQQAEILRQKISQYAARAVKYGKIDRDWVNTRLARIGAEPVTGSATYKINVAITGNYGATVTAATRADALNQFQKFSAKVAAARQFATNYCDEGVYNIAFTGEEPTFYSGPQDPPVDTEASTLDLDTLKDAIRQMLKDGVARQGWGIDYAAGALTDMGLEPLPTLHDKTVTVPVSGTATIVVPVFEGDDDEAVQLGAGAVLGRAQSVSIKPDEIGWASWPTRPEGQDIMGLTLVDEDEDGS